MLGPLKPAYKNDELIVKMKELEISMINDAWLYQKGKRTAGRVVKVRSGLEVIQRIRKAIGGLIRAEFAVEDGKYKNVSLTGDFFCFPSDSVDRLAVSLEDCPFENVSAVVMDFYQTEAFDTLGVAPDDWIQVLRI